jgi:hypothetical protein
MNLNMFSENEKIAIKVQFNSIIFLCESVIKVKNNVFKNNNRNNDK